MKASDEEVSTLVRAYALGEAIMDIEFKNTVIEALISIFAQEDQSARCFPSGDDVSFICEALPTSSLLRKLAVDAYVYIGFFTEFGYWTKRIEKCPKEFLVDVATALFKRPKPSYEERPWVASKQQYLEANARDGGKDHE